MASEIAMPCQRGSGRSGGVSENALLAGIKEI